MYYLTKSLATTFLLLAYLAAAIMSLILVGVMPPGIVVVISSLVNLVLGLTLSQFLKESRHL